MTTALFVGTFDPMIAGQVDIAVRASQMFTRVVVVVEAQTSHKALLSTDERLAWAKEALAKYPTIEVQLGNGTIAEMVKATSATCWVVGMRSAAAVEQIVSGLQPQANAVGVEVVALLADPAHSVVTTALVRDVVKLGGNYHPFVPNGMTLNT